MAEKIIVSGFPKYCLWTTSILLPKQKYDCKPICYIPNVAFAPLGRTIRGVHQPRVPLLRRSALGYMLLPLRGVKINVSAQSVLARLCPA